ncbi:sel1 repeat family protein [Marilutibacter aestuarii]|uniref:Sel1 repeat family protein n=1 Tax=Marilutibacter aestuarii TaxID=1706195 RepID=A0A508AMK5_9GAMM|nr:sel1 repeat family protein [Lysobacter aestuarii]TQD51360.1 sel1 repeat family protein [Lysobacter aestuarii]
MTARPQRPFATRQRLHAALLAVLSVACTGAPLVHATDVDPTADAVTLAAGYLNHHPDINFRMKALRDYNKGEYEDAIPRFQRAAFYADKPSQGMLGEMYWEGKGVAVDRAMAYAWMDLAAERGYAGFLNMRERYWSQMDETERARALEVGQALYAKYGDDAARPRIDAKLRFGRRSTTGSRTGFSANLTIQVPMPDGSMTTIQGAKFYDDKYWDPKEYFAWQDSIWEDPPIGRVDVGEVEAVREAPSAALPSRVPEVVPETDAAEPEVPEDE